MFIKVIFSYFNVLEIDPFIGSLIVLVHTGCIIFQMVEVREYENV